MNTTTSLISERLNTLPMTDAERREALGFVAAGETLAQLFVSLTNWLDASPSLKPSYR